MLHSSTDDHPSLAQRAQAVVKGHQKNAFFSQPMQVTFSEKFKRAMNGQSQPSKGGYHMVTEKKTSDATKMAENSINCCTSADPTPPSQTSWNQDLKIIFPAENQKKTKRFVIFKPNKGVTF